MAITGYSVDAYADAFGKWSTYVNGIKDMYFRIFKNKAEINGNAPNPKVYTADGKTRVNLLDTASPGRPLVLNFGSCSWPPFIARLAEFKRLVAEFADIADYTTIYITEAHASDGFDFIGNKYKIKQHTSLQERILAASILLEDEDLNIPGALLIDNMENEAKDVYGAFPERLYIVLDGKILFVGDEGPMGYSVEAVKNWLGEYKAKSQ